MQSRPISFEEMHLKSLVFALAVTLVSCTSPTEDCHTGIFPEVAPDSVHVQVGETFTAGAGQRGCDYRRPAGGIWVSQDASVVEVTDSVLQKSSRMTIGQFQAVRIGNTQVCLLRTPVETSCGESPFSVPVRVTDE